MNLHTLRLSLLCLAVFLLLAVTSGQVLAAEDPTHNPDALIQELEMEMGPLTEEEIAFALAAQTEGVPWINIKEWTRLFRDFTREMQQLLRDDPQLSMYCEEVWYPKVGSILRPALFQPQTCGFPTYMWIDFSTIRAIGNATVLVCFRPLVVENVPIFQRGMIDADGWLNQGGVGWQSAAARFNIAPCQPLAYLTGEPKILTEWQLAWQRAVAHDPSLEHKKGGLGLGEGGIPKPIPELNAIATALTLETARIAVQHDPVKLLTQTATNPAMVLEPQVTSVVNGQVVFEWISVPDVEAPDNWITLQEQQEAAFASMEASGLIGTAVTLADQTETSTSIGFWANLEAKNLLWVPFALLAGVLILLVFLRLTVLRPAQPAA